LRGSMNMQITRRRGRRRSIAEGKAKKDQAKGQRTHPGARNQVASKDVSQMLTGN